MIKILVVFLLCVTTVQANAQDYVQLESLGTKDSLGSSIYQNTPRSKLIKLLKSIAPTSWSALDKTMKDLILADTDASLIQNDIKIEKGQDILTLRLNFLLQHGMNKDALKLYNKTESQIITEPLARLGTIAMLLNQQKAQACLETKTFHSQYKASSFWADLNAYCTVVLSQEEQPDAVKKIMESKNTVLQSIIQSNDYRFEYEPTTFSKLNFLQRALLVSEDRIIISLEDTQAYDGMPHQHIGALIHQSNLKLEMSLFLSIQATQYGIITEDDLTKKYNKLIEKDFKTNTKNSLIKILKSYNGLKKNAWNPLKKQNTQDIKNTFQIAQKYGEVTLLPLLPYLEKLKIGEELSLKNLRMILKAYLYTNKKPPKDWYMQLTTHLPEEKQDILEKKTLLIALGLLLNQKTKAEESQTRAKTPTKNLHSIVINIIENIDKPANNVDNFMYIYENDFDLRKNQRYTLPPYEILKVLEQSSKNQNISITLILASIAMSAADKKTMYWGTLEKIVNALSLTGFNRVSDGILAQAILETE